MKKDKYLVIDCETTGLVPQRNQMLTLAILLCEKGTLEPIAFNEFKFKYDTYNVSIGALKTNKIDLVQHDSEAKYTFEHVIHFIKTLYALCENQKPTVIGHNVGFDLSFIHHYIGKEEWEKYVSYRNIDTCTIARFLSDAGIITTKNVSLENMVKYFNLSKEDDAMHTALCDATKTWELYCKLLDTMDNLSEIKENDFNGSIICIMGKSASGKSTLINKLVEQYPDKFHAVKSYTTRAIREDDSNDINTHIFVDDDFWQKNRKNAIAVYCSPKGYVSWADESSFDKNKINLYAIDPISANNDLYPYLSKNNIKSQYIYLNIPFMIRSMRYQNREGSIIGLNTEEHLSYKYLKDIPKDLLKIFNTTETSLEYLEKLIK